jgi:cell division transport system permease protein
MSRLRLVISEALRSLGSNLSTTFAATMTVLIGMFLLGTLVALGTWVVSWSDHAKKQLEVKVYFLDSASVKQVNAVRVDLAERKAAGEVKQYRYISKGEALEIMRRREPEFVRGLPSNPLPASYTVTPKVAEDVQKLSASLRQELGAPVCRSGRGQQRSPTGVECVKDGEQTSRQVLKVSRVIEISFLVMVIVLLIASVLLIANTIRLSIFSRRREIEVMKLVGATNWFVRGPFMIEGLICGGLGALAAIVLLLIGKETVLSHINQLNTTPDVKALTFPLIALILVGVGLVVGALGSGLTMRRYLRV